jgi:hypothetical protein
MLAFTNSKSTCRQRCTHSSSNGIGCANEEMHVCTWVCMGAAVTLDDADRVEHARCVVESTFMLHASSLSYCPTWLCIMAPSFFVRKQFLP